MYYTCKSCNFAKNNTMKLALIGATGLVGREMLQVIEEFQLNLEQFIPVASARSLGQSICVFGKEYSIVSLDQALQLKPDIVLYSAGSEISLATAEQFVASGAYVIDNSSAWRMVEHIPLVVPEVNISTIPSVPSIVANPNCSTIQMVVALHPLHRKFGIKRIVVSTYQSVSGTGAAAVKQLHDERNSIPGDKVYPHQIDMNCFPHGGSFLENGYTTEEMKLVHETRKILNDFSIEIEATVVRIPVLGGHSESVFIELNKAANADEVKQLLIDSPGIVVIDNPKEAQYPMPLLAQGKNETFVGRIRTGLYSAHTLQMWIVADNLRKGAATNAVQIAEYIQKNFLQ